MADHAQAGDTVTVHYTGKLEDGSVFDTSRERDPIEFELGSGSVIPGFEEAVAGMEVGERREIRLAPDKAYGERDPELEVDVSRTQLPEGLEPAVGQVLGVRVASGQERQARITEVRDESVKLDLNHPLAGQKLLFDIELVGIG